MSKKHLFSQSQFVASTLCDATYPQIKNHHGLLLPEIAIVGKSNVGKSSLINHLLKRKDLARVSATPGKTQTINFFTVDNELALVDLPGYGFAKANEEMKQKWAQAIDHYLTHRHTLKLILFLIDSRRLPTEEDCAFAKWASHRNIPILIIFTKADTLTAHEKTQNALNSLNLLENYLQKTHVQFLHYSIKDKRSRIEVIDRINNLLT